MQSKHFSTFFYFFIFRAKQSPGVEGVPRREFYPLRSQFKKPKEGLIGPGVLAVTAILLLWHWAIGLPAPSGRGFIGVDLSECMYTLCIIELRYGKTDFSLKRSIRTSIKAKGQKKLLRSNKRKPLLPLKRKPI